MSVTEIDTQHTVTSSVFCCTSLTAPKTLTLIEVGNVFLVCAIATGGRERDSRVRSPVR